MRAVSWNVNGLRAVLKKDFCESMEPLNPDIICLQETKATEDQIDKGLLPKGYHTYFSSGAKKGYSGVVVLTRLEPLKTFTSISGGDDRGPWDGEGRIMGLEFEDLTLINVYFPNGSGSPERLEYKLGFYGEFLCLVDKLHREGKRVVLCGDVNTAHMDIDLARPKANRGTSGFLPQERAWVDTLVEHGMIDSFRELNPETVAYTWWDMVTRARLRDVGWRIDYFFVSKELVPRLKRAGIHGGIMGSDHCPISIDLDLG